MDAIVISGGRGFRLGSLTRRYNKGAIRFQGIPVIARIVDNLCRISDIEKIHVVTGHQSKSIECVLGNLPPAQNSRIILTRGPSETIGMLQRIALTIPIVRCDPGAFVMGIDSLISTRTMEHFVSRVIDQLKQGENRITILCSTNIDPAPTHYRVYEVGNEVIRHLAPKDADAKCTLRSVGVRYLPGETLRRIRKDAPRRYGENISPYISYLMAQGARVHSITTSERWVHIGYPRDFNAKP